MYTPDFSLGSPNSLFIGWLCVDIQWYMTINLHSIVEIDLLKVVQFLNAKEIFFSGPILFLCYIIPHFLCMIATNCTPNPCKWLVCDNKSISREMLKCRINLPQTLTNWLDPWMNVIWKMGMRRKKKLIASVSIFLSLTHIHTHTPVCQLFP